MLEWSNQYETMTQKIGRTFKLLTLLGRLLEKICQGRPNTRDSRPTTLWFRLEKHQMVYYFTCSRFRIVLAYASNSKVIRGMTRVNYVFPIVFN